MYALVCTNEDGDVFPITISNDKEKLRKKLEEAYDLEVKDALNSGYTIEDIDAISEKSTDWARMGIEDSWHYDWTIVEVAEEI